MEFYVKAILVSFIISLIGLALVKENRVPVLLWFSFFLLSSFVVEYTGSLMSGANQHTAKLYNTFTLVEFVFYFFFFRTIFTSARMKRLALIAAALYVCVTVPNILFFQKDQFHTYTYVLGCIMTVVFSIMYFYSLLRFPEKGTLIKNPFFWIVSGLLFYYTCTFSLYGLNNFITETMRRYNQKLFLIGDILNVLLYTSFSIGYLCKINFRKS